jgi:hypothetical protein
LTFLERRIGIGRGLTASPLPHHRTYGSRIRRFGRFSQSEPSPQPEHWVPECQQPVHPRCRARSPAPRRMPSRRSTPGHHSYLPFRPSAHPRCGLAYPLPRLSALGCLTSVACVVPNMPSADFCLALRGDLSPLSPCRGCRMRFVFSVAAWFPGGATLFHPYPRRGHHADLPE